MMRLDADLDVVEDGEVIEEADVLERPRDAQAGHAVGGQVGDVLAVELDRAGRRRHHAREQVEQRGLASPVGTDDAMDGARRQAQVVVGQRDEPAEALRQPG